MANPFEDFIQTELPKRPFLPTDVPLESVIVRRGQGARQLTGVVIGEGQVLGMKDGELQGVAQGSGGGGSMDAIAFEQSPAASTWTVTHNRNNVNVSVVVYDADGKLFVPDGIQANADEVIITTVTPVAGRAILIFVPAA